MEIENIKKEDIKAIQYAIARADDRKFFYIYGANNFDLALKHVDNFHQLTDYLINLIVIYVYPYISSLPYFNYTREFN